MSVNVNFVRSLRCSLSLFKVLIKTFIALSTGTERYKFIRHMRLVLRPDIFPRL